MEEDGDIYFKCKRAQTSLQPTIASHSSCQTSCLSKFQFSFACDNFVYLKLNLTQLE